MDKISRLQKLEADNFRLFQQLQTAIEQARGMGLELQELRREVEADSVVNVQQVSAVAATLAPQAGQAQPMPQPTTSAPPVPAPANHFSPSPPRPSFVDRWNSDGKGIEKLVAVLGTFITLVGVTLFLVQGTEKEWLNMYGHIAIVVVLASLLMVLGHRLIKNKGKISVTAYDGRVAHNVGATALIATGYAALYIDLVAGVNYYKWLSLPLAITLATLVMLMGVIHALYLNSRVFSLLVVTGSMVLLPFMVEGNHLVFLYLALSIVTLVFYYRQGDSLLTMVRTFPLLIAFGFWRVEGSYYLEVGVFSTAWFIFVVLQYLLIMWQEKKAQPQRVPLGLLTLSALLGATFILSSDYDKRMLSIFGAAIAIVFVAASIRFSNTLRTVFCLLALISVLTAVSAYTSDATTGVFSLVSVIITVYLAKKMPSLVGTWTAVGASSLALSAVAASGLDVIFSNPAVSQAIAASNPYAGAPAAPSLGWQVPVQWCLALFLTAAVMWASSLVERVFPKELLRVALAALGLYLWMGFLVFSAFFFSYSGLSFIVAHMMTTLSFIGTVVALLAFSGRLAPVWRRFALGLLLVAVGKLFLFDLQALDGLFRVIAFTFTGVILLALNALGLLGKRKTKVHEITNGGQILEEADGGIKALV